MVHKTLSIILASVLAISCQSSSGKKNSDPAPKEQKPDRPSGGGANLLGIETVSKESPWQIYGELQEETQGQSSSFATTKEASLYFTLVLRKHTKTMPGVDKIKEAFALYFVEDNRTLRQFDSEADLMERAGQDK